MSPNDWGTIAIGVVCMAVVVNADGRRTYLTTGVVAALMVVAVNASDGFSETRVSRRLGPRLSDKGGRSGAEAPE